MISNQPGIINSMLSPPPALLPPSLAAAPRRKWLGRAVCVLALLSGPVARGDIQKSSKAAGQSERARHQEEPPPSAVAGKASVNLDGSVEIVLQAHGGESQEVDFLVRQPPAHGTLAGPPRQLTRNTAAITYVHRAGDGARDDVFTFAVQVLGGRVSASAPVVIGVADSAPELVATPVELDFGAVNAGDTSRAEITLENRGGGVTAGELVPPAPWEVAGPPGYRLARGERRTFPLVFRPVRDGSFSETMRLPGQGGGRGVHLIGIGLGTLAAPVAAIEPVPPTADAPAMDGSVPPTDHPRPESTPLAAAPAVLPAASVAPAPTIPPPAAPSAPIRESSTSGRTVPLLVLSGWHCWRARCSPRAVGRSVAERCGATDCRTFPPLRVEFPPRNGSTGSRSPWRAVHAPRQERRPSSTS